ncbi:hypothetical protein J2Y46_002605 [Microbacterium sp. BE35]|uniref:hypothetical protein n=1 Tax=Microbacterium sp. BE35 TaxID=2817773 RepID=UPI00285D6F33|nr:hypothetical protein [Microbacterium sp. BE35]MDR7189779.1 hypothetical protein [Microbacterium sp. BE35]
MSDDFSELLKLAQDLANVPAEASANVRSAVRFTATNVKKDWRAGADRTGLGGYAADVTYETRELKSSVVAEIGPTPGDSGSFGLVEDARGDVRSAPQHAGRTAMRKNEQDFIEGLAKAVSDIL